MRQSCRADKATLETSCHASVRCCKRYARLTLAFSKKLENHVHAFALHTMYHNFVKISNAHRMSPAMAAGVESRLLGDW